MYKIDLHTHSTYSPDGGITPDQYVDALNSGVLDCIAITDHNSIDFATHMNQQLGEQIIVGEEIMTTAGELVGLFLVERIAPGLSPNETVKQIKDQGGLVYVPHPFETIRKGLDRNVMEEIVSDLDIVEVCNGRAFLQKRHEQAVVWARMNHIVAAASSDAHGQKGIGKTYSTVNALPNRNNLVELLAVGTLTATSPGLRSLLYPKYHRLRKKLSRKR